MNKELYVHMAYRKRSSKWSEEGDEFFKNIYSRKNECVVEQKDNENKIYCNMDYGYTRDH